MAATLNKKRRGKQTGSFLVSSPQPLTTPTTQKIVSWQVTLQFISKDDAEDFIEDMNLLKDPYIQESFKKAAKESLAGKGRSIEELFQEYGI